VYVGYLRAAKGLEELLEAFERLARRYPVVELSFVGDGDLRAILEERVNGDPVLRGRVTFFGHVDDRMRLRTILRSHDFFCFFSRSEGSPRVVIEAMAEGVPVIATRVGSLPFCFQDETEIIFTSGFTSDAIYERLASALQLTTLDREVLRRSAYDKVRRDFLKDQFLGRVFS
jgi:glycosyltransferase involved in cell wall biosynthesis